MSLPILKTRNQLLSLYAVFLTIAKVRENSCLQHGNTFTVVGGDTVVEIMRDLDVNEASFNLEFDFDGSANTT